MFVLLQKKKIKKFSPSSRFTCVPPVDKQQRQTSKGRKRICEGSCKTIKIFKFKTENKIKQNEKKKIKAAIEHRCSANILLTENCLLTIVLLWPRHEEVYPVSQTEDTLYRQSGRRNNLHISVSIRGHSAQ